MWLWIGVILLSIVGLWYWWSVKNVGKLEAQGLKSIKPIPFVGSHSVSFYTRSESFTDFTWNLYQKVKNWDLGVYYAFGNPVLFLNDPELIKEIAVKSFDHFTDRLVIKELNEVQNEGDKMLVTLTGEEWKAMRAALSPSFTTGKLKNLTTALDSTGPDFCKYVTKKIDNGENVFEMRDLFGRFAMGMIGKSVFGVNANVFDDEESEFVKNAKILMLNSGYSVILKFLIYLTVPKVGKAFKIRLSPLSSWNFFKDMTESVMQQKTDHQIRSNDMLQVLMDYRDKHQDSNDVCEDDRFEKDAQVNVKVDAKKIMSNDAITQASILFLLAGFDTTANTLSMISYHIATNPDVQTRLQQEIDDICEKLGENEELNYEHITELEYLDMVISESNRLSPIAFMMERICSKEYTMSNGIKLSKGQRVQVLTAGIHKDERYWPNPDKFDPERFSKENKKNVNPYVYLPFGIGPRNCIGMRFALMEVKVAIFHLLKNFILEPTDKTPIPVKYDKKTFTVTIEGGNHLKLIPRK